MDCVDCHLHLQDPVFAPDFSAVLERARKAGVKAMLCNSTCEGDWARVAQLATQIPEVVPCFGIHPWYLANRSKEWTCRLATMLESIPSAIGEAGLDRWREDRDEGEQERVFREQLRLARTYDRPVMVHCLKAWGWFMRVLESEGIPPGGFVLHAYGGPVELIQPLTQAGAYFSFAGNVLDVRKARMRASLEAVPADRLLIETDSPDLPPPEPYRCAPPSRPEDRPRNEPANLGAILPAIAQLRGLGPEELAAMVRDNVSRLLSRIAGLNFKDGLIRGLG